MQPVYYDIGLNLFCRHLAEKLEKPLFLHERSASEDFIRRFRRHPDICGKRYP